MKSVVWHSPESRYKLTHWGRVTHICISNLTIIGSDNGLSPGQRQAIIRTSAGILFIGPLGTNFSEILIEILTFSFKKMRLKVSSGKWRPFCLGLNVLSSQSLTCAWRLITPLKLPPHLSGVNPGANELKLISTMLQLDWLSASIQIMAWCKIDRLNQWWPSSLCHVTTSIG